MINISSGRISADNPRFAPPATVPEFAPEPFNAQRAAMGLDQPFAELASEQQALIQETALRLNPGKPDITDADREAAVTFLVRTELTKPVFAEDLGIAPEHLVFVDQPDFHIDMYMRPMAPGQMMLNDFEANDRLLQDALGRAEPGSWEARELEGMITRNPCKLFSVCSTTVAFARGQALLVLAVVKADNAPTLRGLFEQHHQQFGTLLSNKNIDH